jgi:hypothetical protein
MQILCRCSQNWIRLQNQASQTLLFEGVCPECGEKARLTIFDGRCPQVGCQKFSGKRLRFRGSAYFLKIKNSCHRQCQPGFLPKATGSLTSANSACPDSVSNQQEGESLKTEEKT